MNIRRFPHARKDKSAGYKALTVRPVPKMKKEDSYFA